jgi:hypothetical protein
MEDGAVPLAFVNEKVLNALFEWQPSQATLPIGTWLDGKVTVTFGVLPTSVFPAPWQVTQLLVNPAWFIGGTALAITNVVKLLAEWQFVQAVEPIGMWLDGSTLVAGVPAQVLPCAWQVAQLVLETAACTIEGGAVPLALVNLKPPVAKLVFEWQLSQAADPNGTWLDGGCTSAGGAMLAKLLPVAWHCAQLLVMFTWFIT